MGAQLKIVKQLGAILQNKIINNIFVTHVEYTHILVQYKPKYTGTELAPFYYYKSLITLDNS